MPHGIIFEDEICYSSDYVANWHSWKKDGIAGMITGGGQAVAEGYPTLDLDITVRYSVSSNSIELICTWESNYSYVDSNAYTRINLN